MRRSRFCQGLPSLRLPPPRSPPFDDAQAQRKKKKRRGEHNTRRKSGFACMGIDDTLPTLFHSAEPRPCLPVSPSTCSARYPFAKRNQPRPTSPTNNNKRLERYNPRCVCGAIVQLDRNKKQKSQNSFALLQQRLVVQRQTETSRSAPIGGGVGLTGPSSPSTTTPGEDSGAKHACAVRPLSRAAAVPAAGSAEHSAATFSIAFLVRLTAISSTCT